MSPVLGSSELYQRNLNVLLGTSVLLNRGEILSTVESTLLVVSHRVPTWSDSLKLSVSHYSQA